MIQSMTGFARGESEFAGDALALELRSVNHRFLELQCRLPEPVRGLEAELRRLIGEQLSRGKVDLVLRAERATTAKGTLDIDEGLAAEVGAAARAIAIQLGGESSFNPVDVLRWPGVVREPTMDAAGFRDAITALVSATLEKLVANRRAEGARIETALRDRAAEIGHHVAAIRARLPKVREALRERLRARLGELEVTLEEERLSRLLVSAAQKIDVAEELDRLDSHIVALEDALASGRPVGRRLNFLMQEFNREANTLGSKPVDTETSHAAVEIKVLIEQMREQVQNVE